MPWIFLEILYLKEAHIPFQDIVLINLDCISSQEYVAQYKMNFFGFFEKREIILFSLITGGKMLNQQFGKKNKIELNGLLKKINQIELIILPFLCWGAPGGWGFKLHLQEILFSVNPFRSKLHSIEFSSKHVITCVLSGCI